jgi:2'-5' RNA ligase
VTRAFVAVALPDPVRDGIERVWDTVEVDGVRRTTRDQWHITLQFLGNVDDLDAVGAALDPLPVAAATVQLGGAGAFPRARRAKVLWLGARQGVDFLGVLAGAVASRLAPLGLVPESRQFHPHVTLARAKQPADVRAAVRALDAAPDGPAWTVQDVVLFESRLGGSGSRYVERSRVTLRP